MTQPADPLHSSSQPTDRDRENARIRQEIAARQAEEYGEAERLALAVLGPGWTPWMKLCLIDSDRRHNGNTVPAATVYKVYRGRDRLTENSVFLRRMPDGQVVQAQSYEPLLGDLLSTKHPTRTVEVRGRQMAVDKYELCWSALEQYHPKTATELAQARATRERNKEARRDKHWAEENPLLAWAERANRQDAPAQEESRGW